ncbi:hypothetical protein N6H14_01415 [Paenibacillus sp. CC-CFT747]|nr:hypothetical protein N6H14_01415 [Paenibacillus sp. CC-CFT747]
MKKLLLRHFPFLYKWRVRQLCLKRHLQNLDPRLRFARKRSPVSLPHVAHKHKSVLRRVLAGTDPQLQENKITNLQICLKTLDGIQIAPGKPSRSGG